MEDPIKIGQSELENQKKSESYTIGATLESNNPNTVTKPSVINTHEEKIPKQQTGSGAVLSIEDLAKRVARKEESIDKLKEASIENAQKLNNAGQISKAQQLIMKY